MAAYLIAEITVTDPAIYEEYRKLVGATLEQYGGKFLVRGGVANLVEGEGAPGRMVVVEFESMERLKAWYDSEEYRHPKALRHQASIARLMMLEGV
jgi:uncharacterized protein (DUF1330 family)